MKRGYLLAEIMIAIIIAGTVATIFTTMNYYSNIQSNLLKLQNTKMILEVLRSRLLETAEDPDSDSFFELLKEDENSSIPINIGLGTDAWGKRIFYSTVDLGDSDGTNTPYADTSTQISPNENIVARLISSGENYKLETNSTHSVAQNDDLMIEIGIGELNHYKLYGSSEITTETRGYNSAIVSATEPSQINGTLWYDTVNSVLKMYNATDGNWTSLN